LRRRNAERSIAVEAQRDRRGRGRLPRPPRTVRRVAAGTTATGLYPDS